MRKEAATISLFSVPGQYVGGTRRQWRRVPPTKTRTHIETRYAASGSVTVKMLP